MAKIHLLQAACTVAMLAASPVFAQTNNPTGATPAGGATPAPTTSGAMPADKDSSGAMSGDHASRTHRSAMRHRHGTTAMASRREDTAGADHLNEQSLQAARQGQTFTAPVSGGGSMGSDTHDMHGSGPSGSGKM